MTIEKDDAVARLNNQHAIENKLRFKYAENHQVAAEITSEKACACIYLHGAHVTAFRPTDKNDLLWLSPLAQYEENKAIRGGIPICWPWFGKSKNNPNQAQHGFARTSEFQVKHCEALDNGDIKLVLWLTDSEKTLAIWPYRFELEVHFIIGERLSVELITENKDKVPFELSEAIHSYFSVADIRLTTIEGLSGAEYFDQLSNGLFIQNAPLEFTEETDRVYSLSADKLMIIEEQTPRVCIQQENSNATVVWNPWINKSASMADFPDEGYLHMLCIEAANISPTVKLQSGEVHTLKQVIGVPES